MKLNTLFQSSLMMLLFMFSCQQDDVTQPVTGKATFSISIRSSNSGRSEGAPVPAFVLLSVRGSEGIVKNEVKLALYPFGANYVSENIELPEGRYALTKFLILDASNRAVYATPLKDSELAEYVSTPLPLDFVIAQNQNTEVIPEVLDVLENDDPSRFGYVSFGFEINSTLRNVTFDGIAVQDSLTLHYLAGKLEATDWCSRLQGEISCVVAFTENRFYNQSGQLDSLGGRFNASYLYSGDTLKKIVAYKLDSTGVNHYVSTTTFQRYEGKNPTGIKVQFATGVTTYIDLTFNSSGDITQKIVRDADKEIVEDLRIEYSTTLNTLRRKIESPPYAVVFFEYDELVFYYSRHVPRTLTISRQNSAIVPKNLVVDYQIEQDQAGKLISARAFRNDINIHNITVAYDE